MLERFCEEIRLITLRSWEPSEIYSSRSVYRAHFAASTRCDTAKAIWKSWAPLRCKITIWLIIRSRLWTAGRLAKRGLPHNDHCVFCNATEEDPKHLFINCAVSSLIWGSVLVWAGLSQVVPTLNQQSLRSWWRQSRDLILGEEHKRFNSVVMLVTWSIWRERNRRVFENSYKTLEQIVVQIKQEAKDWAIASGGRFRLHDT